MSHDTAALLRDWVKKSSWPITNSIYTGNLLQAMLMELSSLFLQSI